MAGWRVVSKHTETQYRRLITIVEMIVPTNAKRDIVKKFLKKAFCSIAYPDLCHNYVFAFYVYYVIMFVEVSVPASNMIGGNNRKKKTSGSKVRNSSSSLDG